MTDGAGTSEGEVLLAQSERVGLWQIAWTFFMLGATTFGGLFAVLPRIVRVLTRREWLTHDQVNEVVAVSALVPAPTYTAFAGVVGHRLRGWVGSIIGVVAILSPSGLMIALLMWLVPPHLLTGPLQPLMRSVAIAVSGVLMGNGIHLLIRQGRSVVGRLLFLACTIALLWRMPVAVVVIGGVLIGRMAIRGG